MNFILALRLQLLKEVERLQQSLGVAGDVAYTCETAGHFFLYQVRCSWGGPGVKGHQGCWGVSSVPPLPPYRWCHGGRSSCPE